MALTCAMDPPHEVRVADGRTLKVFRRTCPVRISLITNFGPVLLDPFPLAILPGIDDVLILGSPTLELLGLDVYAGLINKARTRADASRNMRSTVNYIACRRVSIPQEDVHPEPAVERTVDRGPEMVMEPALEEHERRVALEQAVEVAASNGLDDTQVAQLKQVVLERRWNAFRRALRGDPPAKVEPMRVVLKPNAQPVKARPRGYPPAKAAWLVACVTTLMSLGFVFRNMQAVWASPAMAAPKKQGYRLVSDYRAVNKQIEKVPGIMPDLEAELGRLRGAGAFATLDFLQCYWQCPSAAEAQEIFTIATPQGLFTPTRVPQGVLNATAYFQATLQRELEGLNCMTWVDDILMWGADFDDLLRTIDEVLGRLERWGCMRQHTNACSMTLALSGAGRCTREVWSNTIRLVSADWQR